VVALNAGALLLTAGLAPTSRRRRQAKDVIASGAAYRAAQALRRGDQWLSGVLGEIVARKRVDVAARLAGVSLDALRAAPSRRGAASRRRSPGPAPASSWR
jgi:hypothetical protein